MDTTGNSLEQCLAVVKRFLLCPVCLDDFRNPVITPCAHIFCKFCIYEHIGKKRRANCPLCMKPFTRRSIKHSGKLNEITTTCHELVTTYEEESGATLRPSSVPDEFLHLSQELTQRPRTSSCSRASLFRNEVKSSKLAQLPPSGKCTAKKSTRTSKIFLGTAARAKYNQPSNDDDGDLLLTQPMGIDSTNKKTSSTRDDEDLLELFASTQLTQPMSDINETDSVEFTPVMGFSSRLSNTNTNDKQKPNSLQMAHKSTVALPITSRHKGIRTIPSRPPLPPRAPLNTRSRNPEPIPQDLMLNNLSSSGKRTLECSLTERPQKQTRRESSHSTLSSAHGILTKTHEVVCQVNVTERQSDNTNLTYEGYENGLKRLPSRSSIRSWPLKGSPMQLSVEARNQLLRKYNLTRKSLSFKNMKIGSTISPGWSRWRTMCRELKRRGSASSLSFHTDRNTKLPFNVTPNRRFPKTVAKRSMTSCSVTLNPKIHSTNSGSFLNRISDSVLRRSKRDRMRKEAVKNFVPETQNSAMEIERNSHGSCIITETPISPEKPSIGPFTASSNFPNKPCQFIIPLKRLVSHSTCSRSNNGQVSDRSLSNIMHSSLTAANKLEVDASALFKSPVNLPPSADKKTTVIHSTITNPNYHLLHCSGCGESMFVQPSGLSTPCGSPSHTAIRTTPSISNNDLSCSISSTYWQAEDPWDSALSGFHTDHLVSLNRTAANSVSLFSEVGCQTSFDASNKTEHIRTISTKSVSASEELSKSLSENLPTEPPKDTTTSISPHTVTKEPLSVDSISTSALKEPIQSVPSSVQVESNIQDSFRPAVGRVDSLESPSSSTVTSTFQTCSIDVIPTVDRERLQNECNELEAVVAALQQQLEAQAADLSPKTTEELLRRAGTEPCDDEVEVYSRIVDTDEVSQQLYAKHNSPVSPRNAVVTECSLPEPVDVIPSSQADNDFETVGEVPENDENVLPEAVLTHSSVSSSHRVETSQPPSSFETGVCGAVSASLPIPTPHKRIKLTHPQPTALQTTEVHLVPTDLTECPETDLDGLSHRPEDRSVSCVIQGPQRSRFTASTLIVTGSNLTGNGLALLRRFCKLFGVTENSRFVPRQTTHIVMREEPDRPRVVKRTLKYFVGILNRAWIVNTQWLHDSIEAGIILDETPYEIEGDTVCGDRHEGPRRGRLNVPAQPQRLDGLQPGPPSDGAQGPFAGLWLCAFGSLGLLSLSDFMSLALDGGANRVFEQPSELTMAVEGYLKSDGARNTGIRRPRAMILTNHNPPDFSASKCLALYQTHGIPIISIDWMLNCISLYRRIPISPQYRICPSPATNPQLPLTTRNARP